MDVRGRVEGIRRYTVHGEPYAILYFSTGDDRETIHQAQLSADALPANLRVGDAVVITYVGSVVAGISQG